jgi:16S rRNA (uracil1498-N3)-methyltransferase
MNVILFDTDSSTQVLLRTDPRAKHLLEVLKCSVGSQFDVGVTNGPMGKGTVKSVDADEIVVDVLLKGPSVALDDIHIIIGLPRPQTARKILRELSSLGAASLDFVLTESSDRNYASSTLWTSGEWERHLMAGVQQAFTTTIPKVTCGNNLVESIASIDERARMIALDNYEGAEALGDANLTLPLVIAVGPERGWLALDREVLRDSGFHLVHLGSRVLRVETACVSAYSIAKSKLGLM